MDSAVTAQLKAMMRERGITFKEAINSALLAGLGTRRTTRKPFRQKTFKMGTPTVPLRKALQLAAELEDEEILHKMALRK